MPSAIPRTVGPEVVFKPDPLAQLPLVTPPADGSFILAWQIESDGIVAKHLDASGNFTAVDCVRGVSFVTPAQNWTLTTPLIVQGQDGSSPPISAC
jgi:hypothetical protein